METEICLNCNGTGETKDFVNYLDKSTDRFILKTKFCLKCHGKGKIDWIKNIVGLDHTGIYQTILKHSTTSFEKS